MPDQHLRILLNLGKQISSARDLESLLSVAIDSTKKLISADRCSIFIYKQDQDKLFLKAAHGLKEFNFPASMGIAGATLKSGEPQIVIDAYNDFRFYPGVDSLTGYKTNNILSIPLTSSDNRPLGVFQALNKKKGFFTNLDAEMLTLVGEYVSSALEQAQLYDRLQSSQLKIINKLASAAEFKDDETSEHTRRVGLYSSILASSIGLSSREIKTIRLVAPMHDLGKIGIPDSIIKKKGRLDRYEFELIKKHTEIGYRLLHDREDEILFTAAIIARDHHERWDGNGYPQKIKKEEISVHGRIVSLADVFDALMSERPYKKAWSLEKTVDYIVAEREKSFDPLVVDSFLNHVEDMNTVLNKFKDDEDASIVI